MIRQLFKIKKVERCQCSKHFYFNLHLKFILRFFFFLKINFPKLLLKSRVEYYLRIARRNNRLIKNFGKNVITIKSEAVIEKPREQLLKICDFFNVWCSEDYLKECTSIIYSKISKSRNTINWDDYAKNTILKNIKDIPFLKHYKFNEEISQSELAHVKFNSVQLPCFIYFQI